MSDQDVSDAVTTVSAAAEALTGVSGAVELVAYCVMATIIAVGSIGNCIVLYVYARKKDGHAANIFIISLAVSDLIACVLVIPMSIAMEVKGYISNVFVCKLYYLLNCSGIPFSSMLMSAIAVERYFCICWPFLRAITVPRAKAIVLSLGTIALTLGLTVAAFCSVVVDTLSDGPNGTTLIRYTSYGHCREISDDMLAARNDSSIVSLINISDASLVFYKVFQKIHLSLFGVCIVLVFVLYVKIYASVLRLRRKRRERHQNRMQLLPVSQHPSQNRLQPPCQGEGVGRCAAEIGAAEIGAAEIGAAEIGAADDENDGDDRAYAANPAAVNGDDPQSQLQPHQNRRKSLRLVKDSDALQNLKTAAMLFVVTIVFTATFIPAAMMTIKVLDFNMLIFYLYYLTHATNPLIYCFMNRNFRDDLHRIFCPMAAQQRQQQQQQQQQNAAQRQLPNTNRLHMPSTVAE